MKELIFVSTFGGCGGLERTDFSTVSKEAVVLLKRTKFLTVSTFGRVWFLKEHFSSILGGCGGLERTDFTTVSTLGGCGALERTDFGQFLLL